MHTSKQQYLQDKLFPTEIKHVPDANFYDWNILPIPDTTCNLCKTETDVFISKYKLNQPLPDDRKHKCLSQQSFAYYSKQRKILRWRQKYHDAQLSKVNDNKWFENITPTTIPECSVCVSDTKICKDLIGSKKLNTSDHFETSRTTCTSSCKMHKNCGGYCLWYGWFVQIRSQMK